VGGLWSKACTAQKFKTPNWAPVAHTSNTWEVEIGRIDVGGQPVAKKVMKTLSQLIAELRVSCLSS
jgi:hypothetical protein